MKALNELTTHLQNISDSYHTWYDTDPPMDIETYESVNEALKIAKKVREEVKKLKEENEKLKEDKEETSENIKSLVKSVCKRVNKLEKQVDEKDSQLEAIKNLLK